MSAGFARTFASLRVPNYRRYFGGQVVSITGNWMQNVAEMWLVVQLTGSGVSVGLTAGLQFLPILLFGAWGGLLADRMPKRRLLMITQSLMALPALALWALTTSGSVEVWMVYALVLVRGAVNAVDNPARQSFAIEMVGADRVVNAVALNSVIIHTARILGPAAAGIVIALLGVGPCFLVNSLSFAAMLVALQGMDPQRLHTPEVAARASGQLRSALRYVARTPNLRIPLAMMAVVGTLSFNFQVLLPLLASFTWHGTAALYTALAVAMGVGSVAGALAAGARGRVDAAACSSGRRPPSASPSCWSPSRRPSRSSSRALVPLGAVSVTFAAGINSSLQLAVEPSMRGRVMALYSVVFLGSTPIGAPLVGWIAEVAGPRAGLVVGAVAALATAAGARLAFARVRPVRARRPCESSSRTRRARLQPTHGTRP